MICLIIVIIAIGQITSCPLTTRGMEQLATIAIEGLLGYIKTESNLYFILVIKCHMMIM